MYSKFGGIFDVKHVKSGLHNGEAVNIVRHYKLKQHHHMRLDCKFKADCEMWLLFLTMEGHLAGCSPVNRSMIDVLGKFVTSTEIYFYSDASAAANLGFGCLLNKRWIKGDWNAEFMKEHEPSIEYLELFALFAGMITWAKELSNYRIIVFCDNMAVVHMINNLTSSCRNCMLLLRLLVLNSLIFNRRVTVKYVKSADNFLADALSRGQMSHFRRLAPDMAKTPDVIDECIWPLSKLWLN